jgi:hypothetical protein
MVQPEGCSITTIPAVHAGFAILKSGHCFQRVRSFVLCLPAMRLQKTPGPGRLPRNTKAMMPYREFLLQIHSLSFSEVSHEN